MATKKSSKKSKKTAKKSSKKTAKKVAKKVTKKSAKTTSKKTTAQESLTAPELETKLEEQKKELSLENKPEAIEEAAITTISQEEETSGKNKVLIGVLIVILVLIGYLVLFKKDDTPDQKPTKIESSDTPKEQQNVSPTPTDEKPVEPTTPSTEVKPQEKPEEVKYEEYTIQPGDTLSRIMRKFNKSQKEIKEANPEITNWSKIKVGQKIKIPK